MRYLLIHLLLALLAGCAMMPAGRPRPVSYHVLVLPTAPAAQAPRPAGAVLLLPETQVADVLQDERLVYSRTPDTLNHYQYARWSELPGRALNALLRQHLDAAGLYAAVVPVGAGVAADYQLNTRLRSFHHDAATAPGVARVTLEAELVRRYDARLIARQAFQTEAPVPSHDASGAARGLGEASGRALGELNAWLARVQAADAR